MKRLLGLLTILVIALCLVGCTTTTTSTTTSKQTPTAMAVTPKYKTGDIYALSNELPVGKLILTYTPENDSYSYVELDFVNGQWEYTHAFWYIKSFNRESIERITNPVYRGHVDPQSLSRGLEVRWQCPSCL